MALKTKAKIASIGEALGKKSVEFTFQDPPLIDAPFTTITKLDGSPRQLPDPSKIVKPALGIERIQEFNLTQALNERGPNGEIVFKASDERIRYVGDTVSNTAAPGTNILLNALNSYMEITFFGTGLNLLADIDSSSREIFASVDGGSLSGDLLTNAYSGVISNRSYRANQVINISSGS